MITYINLIGQSRWGRGRETANHGRLLDWFY